MIRFVDWFAGIGGFRLGLEKANNTYEQIGDNDATLRGTSVETGGKSQLSTGYQCVEACEIDKWCRRIYARNFGHEPAWADSRAVEPSQPPDFDLFCAGFPCQTFSIAGKRRGFRDIRGTLFFEIVRICGERRPKYLLLENVKGLLSVDNGFTFEAILAVLSDIGYDCQWEVLNSKNFGVPQNRERVFIVGHFRGIPRPKIFPIGEDEAKDNDAAIQITYAIDSNYWKGCYTPGKSNTRTMIANAVDADGYLRQMGVHHDKPICHYRIRRLTPLECERLQGFPDGWTEGVSDTQRYKMLGNAVTVNVIEAIGQRLIEAIADAVP